jgi:hypothetical protein
LERFYGRILEDYERLQMGYEGLKMAYRAAAGICDGGFFEVLRQVLAGLDEGGDLATIRAWFYLNMARITEGEPNLRTDNNGMQLIEDGRYAFDERAGALTPVANGVLGAEEIKLARLMLVSDLGVILRVKNNEGVSGQILHFARQVVGI